MTEFEEERDSYDQDQDQDEESDEDDDKDQYNEAVQYLQTCAFYYRTIGKDLYSIRQEVPADQFILQNQDSTVYQDELWDIGAVQVSTVGKCQAEVYLRENPHVKISWIPGIAEIRFGGSRIQTAIDMMNMENLIGQVIYYILDISISFFLNLYDTN